MSAWQNTPGSKLDKMNSKEAAAYLARQAAQGWPGSVGIHPGGRHRRMNALAWALKETP